MSALSHNASLPTSSSGKTSRDRVGQLCIRVTQLASDNEQLLACCVTSLSPSDLTVLDRYSEIEQVISPLMASALGEVEPANSGLLEPLLLRYLLGGFTPATTGIIAYAQIAKELKQLCGLLLADVWATECEPFDIPLHS